jgi:hypothetical protein
LGVTLKKEVGGMKRLISVSVVAWVTLGISTCAFALLRGEQRAILQGLEGVRVVVERLKPEIERDGLFGSTLQTDVELNLRMAGIKVLSEEEWLKTPGAPYLYLKVNAFQCARGYVYNIDLTLEEEVTPVRKRLKVSATTSKIGDQLGIASSLSDIRGEARDLVDEFIKAWQEANMK